MVRLVWQQAEGSGTWRSASPSRDVFWKQISEAWRFRSSNKTQRSFEPTAAGNEETSDSSVLWIFLGFLWVSAVISQFFSWCRFKKQILVRLMLLVNLPKHIFSANPCLLPASSVADGWISANRAVQLSVIAYLMLLCIKSGIICRLWAESGSLSGLQQFLHMNQNQQQNTLALVRANLTSDLWHRRSNVLSPDSYIFMQFKGWLWIVFSHSLTSC